VGRILRPVSIPRPRRIPQRRRQPTLPPPPPGGNAGFLEGTAPLQEASALRPDDDGDANPEDHLPNLPSPNQAALGVDVARFGADATAFTWIEDGATTRQELYRGASLMETVGRIVEAYQQRPELAVAVDDTGLGGGVTDRLRELGFAPAAVNFGAKSEDPEHDANRSSELYHRLKAALLNNRLTLTSGLPHSDALIGQLARVTYRFTSDGRRAIEKRGRDATGPSPDLADSLVLAWAAYDEANRTAGVW